MSVTRGAVTSANDTRASRLESTSEERPHRGGEARASRVATLGDSPLRRQIAAKMSDYAGPADAVKRRRREPAEKAAEDVRRDAKKQKRANEGDVAA